MHSSRFICPAPVPSHFCCVGIWRKAPAGWRCTDPLPPYRVSKSHFLVPWNYILSAALGTPPLQRLRQDFPVEGPKLYFIRLQISVIGTLLLIKCHKSTLCFTEHTKRQGRCLEQRAVKDSNRDVLEGKSLMFCHSCQLKAGMAFLPVVEFAFSSGYWQLILLKGFFFPPLLVLVCLQVCHHAVCSIDSAQCSRDRV